MREGIDPFGYLTETHRNSKARPFTTEKMKICPNCQMRYEDDALRFCTRDGSPLVAESAIADSESLDVSGALPGRSADTQDISGKTKDEDIETEIPRIVIKPHRTDSENEHIESKSEETTSRSTLKTVLLTVIVTVVVIATGGWFFWIYVSGSGNFLFGTREESEIPTEASPEPSPLVPIRTPNPSPSPTPEASPTPSPSPSPSPTPTATPRPKESPDAGRTPTPRTTPTPDATDARPRRVQ